MWVMCWEQPCCVVGGVARADAAVVLDPFPSERVLQATVATLVVDLDMQPMVRPLLPDPAHHRLWATPLAGCCADRLAACRVIQF